MTEQRPQTTAPPDAEVQPQAPLHSVDATWLRNAFLGGVARVFTRRDHINRINVFPVADADTGTNLAFTLGAIVAQIREREYESVARLMDDVAEFAIDGARGNSGAIFAQYSQGFAEAVSSDEHLTAAGYAHAASAGAKAAGSAIAEPREGTMLTVIRDYATEIANTATEGCQDLSKLWQRGLERARASLAQTTSQLEVLRRNNVVDAGGLGFVELLEGMLDFARNGNAEATTFNLEFEDTPGVEVHRADHEDPEHRFCTECLVSGDGIDRNQLRDALLMLDASSLVIAGTKRKVRVHVHVDHPAKVFLACEDFGEVSGQKADDMRQQTRSAGHGRDLVAVVADTGADIPDQETERLGIHLVPLRVNFGDQQYLDKVSLSPDEFYRQVRDGGRAPRTSQPPPGDFRRQFEFLRSHHAGVLSVNISGALSGTWQNADLAARRTDQGGNVMAFDTRNASAGQALMATYAAEAAQQGLGLPAIHTCLTAMIERTRTYAVISDLAHGVRGGRISPWVKRCADLLRITPVVANRQDGRIGPVGVLFGRRQIPDRFARWILKRLNERSVYRIVIAHCDAREQAGEIRSRLVEGHGSIGTIHRTEAGTALGAHAGPGTLIVGVQEYVPPQELLGQLEASS